MLFRRENSIPRVGLDVVVVLSIGTLNNENMIPWGSVHCDPQRRSATEDSLDKTWFSKRKMEEVFGS